MQLGELRKIEDNLKALGFQIIAVGADSHEQMAKTVDRHSLSYSVYSDIELNAAEQFGLAYTVNKGYIKTMRQFDESLIDANAMGRKGQLIVPGVFIVAEGVIHFSYVNPNYRIRVDHDVVLAAAKAALKKDE